MLTRAFVQRNPAPETQCGDGQRGDFLLREAKGMARRFHSARSDPHAEGLQQTWRDTELGRTLHANQSERAKVEQPEYQKKQ